MSGATHSASRSSTSRESEGNSRTSIREAGQAAAQSLQDC